MGVVQQDAGGSSHLDAQHVPLSQQLRGNRNRGGRDGAAGDVPHCEVRERPIVQRRQQPRAGSGVDLEPQHNLVPVAQEPRIRPGVERYLHGALLPAEDDVLDSQIREREAALGRQERQGRASARAQMRDQLLCRLEHGSSGSARDGEDRQRIGRRPGRQARRAAGGLAGPLDHSEQGMGRFIGGSHDADVDTRRRHRMDEVRDQQRCRLEGLRTSRGGQKHIERLRPIAVGIDERRRQCGCGEVRLRGIVADQHIGPSADRGPGIVFARSVQRVLLHREHERVVALEQFRRDRQDDFLRWRILLAEANAAQDRVVQADREKRPPAVDAGSVGDEQIQLASLFRWPGGLREKLHLARDRGAGHAEVGGHPQLAIEADLIAVGCLLGPGDGALQCGAWVRAPGMTFPGPKREGGKVQQQEDGDDSSHPLLLW